MGRLTEWGQRAQAAIDEQTRAEQQRSEDAMDRALLQEMATPVPPRLDFLGHVCVRVNRDKPLSECVEVYLVADAEEKPGCRIFPGQVCGHPGAIGKLFLNSQDKRIVFRQEREVFPVEEIAR